MKSSKAQIHVKYHKNHKTRFKDQRLTSFFGAPFRCHVAHHSPVATDSPRCVKPVPIGLIPFFPPIEVPPYANQIFSIGAMMAHNQLGEVQGAGLIIHSDRGVQYACHDFKKLLEKHKFVQSMSRKGNCWDNAVSESFFSIIKSELIHHERFTGPKDTLPAIFEYIEVYYNRKRKHSTLGYQTPDQFERYIKSVVCF